MKTIEEMLPCVSDPILSRLQAIELIEKQTDRHVSEATLWRMIQHLPKIGRQRQLRRSIVLKLAQEMNDSAKDKKLQRRRKK